MTIPLPQYAKIKDNYCIAYFGNCKEYILQLKLLRPFMEAKFPGVRVFLACKDAYLYLLKGEERIIGQSSLKDHKNDFAYVRELNCDMRSHPVESFMLESDIPCGPIFDGPVALDWHGYKGGPCLLCPHGLLPTKSLTGTQIEQVTKIAEGRGFTVQIAKEDTNVNWAKWVIGVENEQVFRAAALGIRTSLVPTGFGEKLFKKMFPHGEILGLPA